MSDMEKFYIPRFLDEPFRILFWTKEEFFSLFFPFFLGVIFNKGLIGLIVAFCLFFYLKKLKQGKPSSWFQSWIFWHFPAISFRTSITPESHKRIFMR